MSVVTLAELSAWALRSNASVDRRQGLIDLVRDFRTLDVTIEVAHKFGEVQATLLDRGQRVPQIDLLIGATALIHGLTVVTHNQKHFSMIPGLSLDDWLGA